MTLFNELSLSPALLKALEAEGYERPTPIQTQAIPPVLEGKDLLGIAQTGTGKTAAFALPILQRLAASPETPSRKTCRALVLAPTRELAAQIGESFRTYGRNLTLRHTVVFGGVGHRPQISALSRGVDILVATPGRLIDHMIEGNVSLSETSIFVLDEADQMLDLGFLPAIRRIVKALPRHRQNLFFSATMPLDIASLAADLLHDPVRVAVARVGTAAEKVDQRVIHIEQRRKSALLAELLADPDMRRTLVFTRTKRGADKLSRYLEETGTVANAIHGNKSQRQREMALEDFRSGDCRVLVATDIAARGIDIDGVTHVVNYDLPEVPDAYVHRIGRTARAGADGKAIAFCDPEERGLLRAIERLTRLTIAAESRCGDAALEEQEAISRRRGGNRDSRQRPHQRQRSSSANRRDEAGSHQPRNPRGKQRPEARQGDGEANASGAQHRRNHRDERRAPKPDGHNPHRQAPARNDTAVARPEAKVTHSAFRDGGDNIGHVAFLTSKPAKHRHQDRTRNGATSNAEHRSRNEASGHGKSDGPRKPRRHRHRPQQGGMRPRAV